jgi:hypothetical protein
MLNRVGMAVRDGDHGWSELVPVAVLDASPLAITLCLSFASLAAGDLAVSADRWSTNLPR